MLITSECAVMCAHVYVHVRACAPQLHFYIVFCVTQESDTKVLVLEIIKVKCSDAHNIENIFLFGNILLFAGMFLASSLLVFFKAQSKWSKGNAQNGRFAPRELMRGCNYVLPK